MFSRVLKPTPGLADEPSVREHCSGSRVLVQVVLAGFALCCSSIPLNPASLAADPNSAEPKEVAAVEFSTSPRRFENSAAQY